MKIFDGFTQLDIPKWFTVSQNTMNIKVDTLKVNERYGEVLAGDEYFSSRTLKCEGTLIADNFSEVEKLRSKLTNMLACKVLRVYRDDFDDVFYNCILDESISASYYNGWNIGKAVTISFNLKAIDPYLYSDRQIGLSRKETRFKKYFNNGNITIYPNFFIFGKGTYKGVILESGDRTLELKKTIKLNEKENLFFISNVLFINQDGKLKNKTDCLTEKSLVYPIKFSTGTNVLKCNQGLAIAFYSDTYK